MRNIFFALKHGIQLLRGKSTIIPSRINLGKDVYIGGHVTFDPIADGALISIGDESTIVSGVVILVHDASSNSRINNTWVSPVKIGKRVFIGANSIILPGVSLGDDVVIGAGSVVTKNISEGCVAVGIPAKIIGSTYDLDKKRILNLKNMSSFPFAEYDSKHPIDIDKVNEMVKAAERNGGFFIKK